MLDDFGYSIVVAILVNLGCGPTQNSRGTTVAIYVLAELRHPIQGILRYYMAFKLGRRPALDGLRGICVLLVIALHADLPFSKGGFLGVDGFFVLSGFLITTLLVEEWHRAGKISLRAFYIRRALRLFPALLVLLVFSVLITLLLLRGDAAASSWRGIFLASFYASDWATVIFGNNSSGLGIVQHTWSLGVEEQFYLLWPLLLVFMFTLRMRTKWILAVVSLLIVASALWRALLLEQGEWIERVYKEFDTRADALLIGCSWRLYCRFVL